MSVKRFERVYYSLSSEMIDRDEWIQTIQPNRRICWDDDLQSLAIQHSDGWVDVDCEQGVISRHLADWRFWSDPRPISFLDVASLSDEGNVRLLPLTDIDEDSKDGDYRSDQSVRTFTDDEDISIPDLFLAAYATLDDDLWKRDAPDVCYFWVKTDDGLFGLIDNEDDAVELGIYADMLPAEMPDIDSFSPLGYAVLSHQGWTDELVLVAVTVDEEQAKSIARLHADEKPVIRKVAK